MNKIKSIPAWLAFILTISNAHAQISEGGTPFTFSKEYNYLKSANLKAYSLPAVNNEELFESSKKLALDCEECKKGYWGKGFEVNINIKEEAEPQKLMDGSNLWLYQIESDNALSLQFYFNKFRLPGGAKLFIYNEDRSMILGAFTSANNKHHGMLAIQPIEGKRITIEYTEPQDVDFKGELIISRIIHDFKGIFKSESYGSSGDCNINVACPEGSGWEDEISSVAIILYFDVFNNLSAQCSGALINNTNEDGTPYFLTANHCANNTGLNYEYWNWVFLFNHEAPTCDGTTGPTTQSISGATLLTNGVSSDYLLLELNSTPPSSYGVCYAGWNTFNSTSSSMVVGIHHPSGDIKKISVDSTAPSERDYEFACGCYTHWRVVAWDLGTTEPGSSGSPLYDNDHRIIGQLHRGSASCENTSGYDEYGKFSRSWIDGNFEQWLDPASTGSTTLDTYCPAPSNPCDNIISIDSCGPGYTKTYTGGGPGAWNINVCGYSTPGSEQVYSFVAPETGTYSIVVTSASGYVDYSWKASSCGETNWTCIDNIYIPGTYGSLSWTAGTTYYILLDNENLTNDVQEFYVDYTSSNPCDKIIPIEGCGSGNMKTYTGGGTGVWNTNACGNPTPGSEQVYSFVAPETGTYSIVVTTASDYVNYSWKVSDCGETGWTCIANINSPGTLGSMSWTAGTTYYIMLDDENSTTDVHEFYIDCPVPANPCDNIIPIDSCGSLHTKTFTGGGTGAWDTNACGFSTHGSEQVYSFVAPTTRKYIIVAKTARGYVDYSWKASGCGETDWTCIANINSPGTYGSMSWTAGTTYYILLDDENSTTDVHEFYIEYATIVFPDIEYYRADIEDDTIIGSGDNDGAVEPGESISLPVFLLNSGSGDAHGVSAILSTTDSYITITDDWAYWSTIPAGSMRIAYGFDFDVSTNCPERDVTFTLEITSNESNWTDQFTVHVHGDPCDKVIPIDSCGPGYARTFTGGSEGAWDNNACGLSTYGSEQVYSFIAPATETYCLEVTTASDFLAYSWKASDCGETDWICIDEIYKPGTYGSMSWTAGTTYYILLSQEDSSPDVHEFYVDITFPNIEYYSHDIDDDTITSSGDNDGVVEPGESIEISVTLLNSGSEDAHNVSAILSTDDSYITITDDSVYWGTITADSSEIATTFDFDVSISSPERDVTFTLEITSDEGNWTDHFTVHVYPDPCNNIIPIDSCGSGYAKTFTGGGTGAWDNNACGFSTPGSEQVYSFIALATGIYSLKVTTASGYVDYSWKATGCGETDWTCIDDIISPGTYGSMSWTAGTTYYLLLDDENSTTGVHEFYVEVISVDIEYYSHEIDDDNSISSGDNDSLVEPGESIEMPVTLLNSGSGNAHNVSAILSTADSYITITDDDLDWGTITAGLTRSATDFDFNVSVDCPERDVTFTLEITSDEGNWTDHFTVHVYPDPCNNIIPIDSCGSGYALTFTGGGTGAWDNNACGFSTPGLEQMYSFIAPATGIYSLEITTASGYVDYSWKATVCGETDWTCIANVNSSGAYGSMSWTAGTTYYILLDDENSTTDMQEFYVECPIVTPDIEYYSHDIDDDTITSSGDNDGLVEPGESIEMPVTLLNSGNGDAHNVSAILSTTDSYITVTDDSVYLGTITTGSTEIASNFAFDVSTSSPERDMTFTLEITSDEGNWTDQFTVNVYPDPCNNIIPIDSCGPGNSKVFTSGGTGAWNNNDCGYPTPGLEQVYSFIAPATGTYSLEVTNASGYFVDYSWMASSCGETDWTCIDDIYIPGTYGSMSWTAGSTYYILLDDENSTADVQEFYVECPTVTPDIEYYSHEIDDDIITSSGDNDSLAEPGESIEIPVTLLNSGSGSAHSVSAILSSDDSYITITNDSVYWGTIIAGFTAIAYGFDFDVSTNCPERDVTFTLEITSDEGNWTDQFTIHVYNQPNAISYINEDMDLIIFPNPTSDFIYLKTESNLDSQIKILIMDYLGRLVYSQTYLNLLKDDLIEIDLSDINSGIYFLRIDKSSITSIIKIIRE